MSLSIADVASSRLIASVALRYPDSETFEQFKELASHSAELPSIFAGPLTLFFQACNNLGVGELQRHYVETFDMRRKCSLFLTSWTHGDTRNRGMAIHYFKEIYSRFGLELSDEELPDHLAVVLEFSAVGDFEEGNLLLAEHRASIELLRDSLRESNSPYLHILDCVVASLPSMNPEIEERIRKLALTGPPQEYVGFDSVVSVALQPYSNSSLTGVSP